MALKEKMRNCCGKAKSKINMVPVLAAVTLCQVQMVFAEDDIFDKAKSLMQTLYKSIAGITSVSAGCMAAVCLFLMFFSKNQRTVDESVSWLKRIFVCWVAIMCMSFILNFFTGTLNLSVTGIS